MTVRTMEPSIICGTPVASAFTQRPVGAVPFQIGLTFARISTDYCPLSHVSVSSLWNSTRKIPSPTSH